MKELSDYDQKNTFDIEDYVKHLTEIDEECNEMMDRLVGQMAKNEGVTEWLKSDDWLCWLAKIPKFGFHERVTSG